MGTTTSTAVRGTVATIGHPANDVLIVKGEHYWLYIDSGRPVNEEDFRAGWDILTGPPSTELLIDTDEGPRPRQPLGRAPWLGDPADGSVALTDVEREQRCRREQISHEHYAREDVERIVHQRMAQAWDEGFRSSCASHGGYRSCEQGDHGQRNVNPYRTTSSEGVTP